MRIFLLIIVAIMSATVAACSAEAPAACGFVSDVSGKAQIERHGKKYNVQGLDGILNDDIVLVDKGSSVSINFCGLLKKTEIPGPAKAIVINCKPKLQNGKISKQTPIDGGICLRLTRSSINVVNRRKLISLDEYLGGAVYVSRDFEDDSNESKNRLNASHLKPEFCKNDLSRPADRYAPALEKPFFTWAPVAGAASYHIDIRKAADGNTEPVYSGTAAENRFVYPNESPALDFEECYSLNIQALDAGGKPLSEKSVSFVVIGKLESELFQKSEQSLKEIVESYPDSPDGYAYLGKYYEVSGFYYNALDVLRKALKLEPDNSMFQQKIKNMENISY